MANNSILSIEEVHRVYVSNLARYLARKNGEEEAKSEIDYVMQSEERLAVAYRQHVVADFKRLQQLEPQLLALSEDKRKRYKFLTEFFLKMYQAMGTELTTDSDDFIKKFVVAPYFLKEICERMIKTQ